MWRTEQCHCVRNSGNKKQAVVFAHGAQGVGSEAHGIHSARCRGRGLVSSPLQFYEVHITPAEYGGN